MKLMNRALMTSMALVLTVSGGALATPDGSLVISSALFDAEHDRLCIKGQNFGTPGRDRTVAAPYVTIDRLPMAVLNASDSQVDVALSRTFPPGSYLLTVSRGMSQGQSSSFFITIGGQGPAGPQGRAGEPGATGPQGASGEIGPVGPTGPIGQTGQTGPVGPAGPMGPTGAAGPMGPVGPAGAAGAVGPQGSTGPAGAIGPQGPAGPAGAVGPAGPAGPAGPVGSEGAIGPVGPAGAVGPAGPQGPAGPAGAGGATGAAGPAGAIGPIGAPGPTGPQGAPGVSGYEIVAASAHSANLASAAMLTARATCPSGKRALGGGVQSVNTFNYMTVTSSYPDPASPGWVGEIRNSSPNSGGATDIIVSAICAQVQ